MISDVKQTAFPYFKNASVSRRKHTPRKYLMPVKLKHGSIPKGYSFRVQDYIKPGTIYKITLQTLYNAYKKNEETCRAFSDLAAKFENEYKLDFDFYFPIMNRADSDFIYVRDNNLPLKEYDEKISKEEM